MKGTVKFFNDMKGFGFIVGEDGKEYFVHQTGLNEGVRLHENDSVEFEVEEGNRGPKAVNVRKSESTSESEEDESSESEEEYQDESDDEEDDEETEEETDEESE